MDHKKRAADSGSTIESLIMLDPPLIKEEWFRMWGWYKDAVDRTPLPPPRISLGALMVERVELYIYVLTPRRPIPIKVAPFPV